MEQQQDGGRVDRVEQEISPVGMSWEDWKSAALAKDNLSSLTLLLRINRIFAKMRCMENE